MAFNGAEPVLHRYPDGRSRSVSSPAASQPRTLAPVYGLAEATLGVAFTPVGRGPLVERVERDALERERRAVPVAAAAAAAADENALTTISSGVPIPGFEVRTVDDSGRETPDRVEGRLQFRGPSTTSGYFRDPAATAALFDGDWLESGDLAYVAGGEVYITGRVKDVVIRAGRNLYPYDYEQAAGDLGGVRRGCVALFSAHGPAPARPPPAPSASSWWRKPGSPILRGGRRSGPRSNALSERAARAADGRGGARAAAHRAQDLERQDSKARDGRALRVGGARRATRAASRPLWLRLARLAAGGVGSRLASVRRTGRTGELAYRGMDLGRDRAGRRGDAGPRRDRRPPPALRLRRASRAAARMRSSGSPASG